MPMTNVIIDNLVASALDAAGREDPEQAVGEWLQDLADNRESMLNELPSSQQDETILYSSEALTLVRVEVAPGIIFPPHNHKMLAILAILQGPERNTFYKVRDSGLTVVGEEDAPSGSVVRMTSDVIHSVSNHGSARTIGIHAYLGDLFAADRSLWDPQLGVEHPYSDDLYFSLSSRVDT
jgi:predicted metal-dependent enzyme (double-stranded beta helix superfamily)